jgi:thiol-disulfide isomerase/thioredoxin
MAKNLVRRAGLAAALAVILALGGAHPAASGGAGPPLAGSVANFTPFDAPRPIPQASFIDGESRPTMLADFRGRVVLLNFWATWCGPCAEEMPSLDRLQGNLGGPDFQVVALSLDEQGLAIVDHFYSKLGIENLESYLDREGTLAKALHIQGVPMTLILDRDGRALGGLLGPAKWDSPEAEALIRYYIEKTAPAPAGTSPS